MNYFKTKSVGVVGGKVIAIDVECVQQRRLPYLQIIGGGSAAFAQRERVIAALESTGFRMPNRRITVSIGANVAGLALETADLAVAIAILGSSQAIPPGRLPETFACASLSLDGRLLPLPGRAALRAWARENSGSPLLLPWADSVVLGEEGLGGGFLTLAEVVSHLRDGKQRGERAGLDRGGAAPQTASTWQKLRGQPYAQRVAMIAAAGGHTLLATGGSVAHARALAEAVRALMPEPNSTVAEELAAVRKFYGEEGEGRPLRELSGDQLGRLCRLDPHSGFCGELSLAHGGVFFLSDMGDKPLSALARLAEPVETGKIRSIRGGFSLWQPADWNLVAHSALCACGRENGCSCAPADAERYRARLSKVGAIFQIQYREGKEQIAGADSSFPETRSAVAQAQVLAWRRQNGLNQRLAVDDALVIKRWDPEARQIWQLAKKKIGARGASAMASLALTIGDLRGSEEVSRSDVLEARHYTPGLPLSRSGIILSSAAFPDRNSTAMP